MSLLEFTQFDGERHPLLGEFLELAVVVDLPFHFFEACWGHVFGAAFSEMGVA